MQEPRSVDRAGMHIRRLNRLEHNDIHRNPADDLAQTTRLQPPQARGPPTSSRPADIAPKQRITCLHTGPDVARDLYETKTHTTWGPARSLRAGKLCVEEQSTSPPLTASRANGTTRRPSTCCDRTPRSNASADRPPCLRQAVTEQRIHTAPYA